MSTLQPASTPRNLPPARKRVRAAPTPLVAQEPQPQQTEPEAAAPLPGDLDAAPAPTPAEPPAKDEAYVGYRNPPRKHQWKKGVSGNPRGRTKGSKNIRTIYAARLNDRVKTNTNGRVTTETILEAIIRGLIYDALTKREHRKVVHVLAEAERHRVFEEQADSPAPVDGGLEETDLEIVQRMIDRLRDENP
ncbi:MAG TPA: DUF5681 domain-containing protein [Caulobacteraceae bacterium]|jgi:hypothetical protein|nr:DUF5681 domain-containing protein [Caulobacteraceae bacterium]